MTWDELILWQRKIFIANNDDDNIEYKHDDNISNSTNSNNNTNSKYDYVVMIDDLDMLDMIAPSALEAKQFMSLFLSCLMSDNNNISSTSSSSSSLKYLIAFGRKPQDYRPYLYEDVCRDFHHTSRQQSESNNTSYQLSFNHQQQQSSLVEYLRYRYGDS